MRDTRPRIAWSDNATPKRSLPIVRAEREEVPLERRAIEGGELPDGGWR